VLLHHLTFEPQDDHQRSMIDRARGALEIDHPNVESLLTWEPGDLFCTTPIFRGWRLDHVVDASSIEPALACWVCRVICDGLHHLHELSVGIVHRAVMARHVLVTTNGTVLLRSPGLLHVRSVEPQLVSLGKPNVFEHLSPEQIEGRVPDRRSDVFQVGLLMYELILGRSVFSRGSPIRTMEAIRLAPAPRLSEVQINVPRTLDPVFAKALEKNPADRFQTTLELAFELDRFLVDFGWSGGSARLLDFVEGTELFAKARFGGFL